jgi:hypothetical protein
MCYPKASASRPGTDSISMKVATRPPGRSPKAATSVSRISPWLLVLAACLVAMATTAGCGDNTPTSPSDVYKGFWSGTINDSTAGAGTLRISLTDGSPISGTWGATLPAASPIGFVTSEAVTTAKRSLALACGTAGSIGLSAIVDGKTMSGTYLAFGCGLSSGSISLVRP